MIRLLTVTWLATASVALGADPIRLHPANPHYFEFRGKPTVLVTSAEHYGAVLNRDFDSEKYLDELQTHGLNLTRTFTGVYCEDTKSFGITRNTLAPRQRELLCPWARIGHAGATPAAATSSISARWDDAYFEAAEGIPQAGRQREASSSNSRLFCPFYGMRCGSSAR